MSEGKQNFKSGIIICLGLLWLGFGLVIYTWNESYFFWNQIRLAPSYALSLGVPLYGNLEKDPLVWHLYGPCAPIFYYPAILTGHPLKALVVGICMSWGLMMIGLWSCFRAWGISIQKSMAIILLVFALSFYFRIAWDLFRIMPDLPAVGFALIAMAMAWKEKGFWSGFFLLLSLASKQTMIPMIGVIAWMMIHKNISFKKICYGIGIAGLPFLIGLSWTGEIGRMVDATMTLPFSQPWKNLEEGESYLKIYFTQFMGEQRWLFFGFIISGFCSLRLKEGEEMKRIRFCSALGIIFYSIGVLQFCKIGGATNAFFFGIILFFTTLGIWGLWTWERIPNKFMVFKLTGLGLVFILIPTVFFESYLMMKDLKKNITHPAVVCYEKFIDHPGSDFEKYLPLSQMMAEKKAYHIEDVLQSYRLGGIRVPEENLQRWLPQNGVKE